MSYLLRLALPGIFCLIFFLHGRSQVCTLDNYLARGVSNSPALRDLSNQILTNQYDSLIARASYLPQVSFNGNLMYAPVINGWGYSEVITNGQNLRGTFNVSQQVFNKKTREANVVKYGLESGRLVNDSKISISELRKTITAQYLAAYAALEERNFQQEILLSLENEAKVLKIWTEKGITRQTDYLSFQIEILNLARSTRDLDLQFRKEFWNLNLICGVGDTVTCDLILPVIKDSVPKLVEQTLYFNNFIIDSLLIINEKRLIDIRYRPNINWFADAGVINNEPRYLYQNLGISVGMSLTMPVYDGNQRKIYYDRIRMREETRLKYQENFRFRYRIQLQQLQDELANIRLSMKENERQISLVQELVAADRVLLSAGSLPITDYILALKNLVEAKHVGLLYQIRTQFILNEINFWKQ